MEQYSSNSNKSKESGPDPKKKIEKVVTGNVRTKKKSGLQKVVGIFVPDDVDDIQGYIFDEIVVPAVKDIIIDSIGAFFGVNIKTNRNSNRSGGNAGRVSYRKYYDDRDRTDRDRAPVRNRSVYDFDDVIIDSRGEAEEVLTRMCELIATYDVASVADFYDLVGITGEWTDNKYGWDDLRSAYVFRTGRGYMIKFPRVKAL